MTCETAVELLSAKLDGELTADEAAQLDEHLAQCAACRALWEELAAIHAACEGLEAAPPPELRDRILQNLPARESPASKGKVVPIHWKRWGAMAASFVLVALAAWHLPRLQSTVPAQPDGPQAVRTEAVNNDESGDAAEPSAAWDVAAVEPPTPAPADEAASAGYAGTGTDEDVSRYTFQGDTSFVTKEEFDAIVALALQGAKDDAPSAPLPDYVDNDAVNVNAIPQTSGDNGAPAAAAELTRSSAGGGASPAGAVASTYKAALTFADTDAAAAAPEDAPLAANEADGEVPEPHPELVDGENERAVLFLQAAPSPAYCGVLTLRGGVSLNALPVWAEEDGETRYVLSCAAFSALMEELADSGADFTLRTTGGDISSAAENGLVIVLP